MWGACGFLKYQDFIAMTCIKNARILMEGFKKCKLLESAFSLLFLIMFFKDHGTDL